MGVILDSTGRVLTLNGREELSSDPSGNKFLQGSAAGGLEKLLGSGLKSQSGSVSVTKTLGDKKAIGLYFSAHWCPPCRGFTPQLAKWYTNSLKENGMEIVFVSSDRDESSFNSYFGEMPWLALPFDLREKKNELSAMFG